MNAFITGTDTGVGKTYATALLTRAMRAAGHRTVALKPVCSGDRDDARILAEASGGELDLDSVNPVWFHKPVAPLVAAREEGRVVLMEDLLGWFSSLKTSYPSMLVEGAGGWLAPVAEGITVADFCQALQLPVVVVAANRLGCVNQTLLTLESIRSRGITCLGVVLNSLEDRQDDSASTNGSLIEEFGNVRILLQLSPGQHAIPALPDSFL